MAFSDKLEAWYSDHGRTLPWRGIDDPYRIWLSEIILQQTRIEQGRDYWMRFVAAFPTVADLAAADEEQVLRLWQGLGYYSRARNLHAAARYIVDNLGGCFPTTYDDLLRLPGVGRYTAAAIASFAYRLPHPVIDGNVYRFVARLFGIATPIGTDAAYREFEQLLLHLIDSRRPDRFNAAMMDFGSLQCRPQPLCDACPFADRCEALATGRVGLLPVRAPKRRPTDRWFYYLVIRWTAGGRPVVLMRQRQGRDIWRGLYEFDLVEAEQPLGEQQLRDAMASRLADAYGLPHALFTIGDERLHQLTHRTIHARFIVAELPSPPPQRPADMLPVDDAEVQKTPVPRLIDRYLHGM